jgi:APA family basic amino acid/polyamine antiporter
MPETVGCEDPGTTGDPSASKAPRSATLVREIGVFGAVMMGLGSIIGTGVFVSIGVAAGVAGPAVIPAIGLAAVVAGFNALSSAQLAASHPVSGGTYEYGYRYLRPWLGFSAGWMFLCAKSASAATAALGFAGYLLNSFGYAKHGRLALVSLAAATVVVLTIVILCGIRRSNYVNIAIVSITLLSLGAFVLAGLPLAFAEGSRNLTAFGGVAGRERFWPAFLQATALMFVAYIGYGRIATLGEEVHEPRRTIPCAILWALGASALLYMAVAVVAIAAVGADALGSVTRTQAAPLEVAAGIFGVPGIDKLVALGAMTAMLGVLLNLLLGLSRVLMAMGRRRDMPAAVARLDAARTTPYVAVIAVGCIIVGLTLIGNVKTTWSFSAFTVLIYYAITNLAALFIEDRDRIYGKWVAWAGLAACPFLAFWVETRVWAVGLTLLAIGLAWHFATVRTQADNGATRM